MTGEHMPPETGDETNFGDETQAVGETAAGETDADSEQERDDEAEADDDRLIAWLRQIAGELDPVPDLVSQAARVAFGLRDLDARLAELVHDSAVDAPATAVRGPGPRLLSFETDGVVVECEVTARESRRDITGQLVGGHASQVEARVPGAAAVTVPVDDLGWFSIHDLPAGLVQLRCRLADGATIVTSWAAF